MTLQLPNRSFYMLRHGETVANAEGYAAGSLDSPLTDKGRSQAEAACPLLYSLVPPPNCIVSSTLSRAKDTAILINEQMSLPIHENKGLMEQSFGDWCGMTWEDMRSLMKAGKEPPNGETISGFYKRSILTIAQELEMRDDIILFVTHGGVFDALFDFLGMPEVDVKNCGFYFFFPNDNSWHIKNVQSA